MGWMLSKILRRSQERGSDDGEVLVFFCPGCQCAHAVHVEKPNHYGAVWSWNGNVEKPTFTPSLNCWPNSDAHRCHSFITDGRIQFLGDSTHSLKNQTVDIPPFPGVLDE